MKKNIITILRRNTPKKVLLKKVSELDPNRCSYKFKKLNLRSYEQVYIECDKDGNVLYRGKKQEYRIYSVKDHKRLSMFDKLIFNIKSVIKS